MQQLEFLHASLNVIPKNVAEGTSLQIAEETNEKCLIEIQGLFK